MPSKNGCRRNKRQSRGPTYRRGMEEKDYRIHLKVVNSGKATWAELEAHGLIPKQRNARTRTAEVIRTLERRKAKHAQ